ncbi:MAG: hypothetical protein AB7L09_01290 [Nitrospira sp.]
MPEPRYLGDQPSEPRKPNYFTPLTNTERAQDHERSSAKRAGKRVVPGSGNQLGRPGDIRGDEDLGELKTTKKTDTRIQLKWLRKIAYEALTQGKQPIVEMRFELLTPPCPKEWVMIPADFYNELLERARS